MLLDLLHKSHDHLKSLPPSTTMATVIAHRLLPPLVATIVKETRTCRKMQKAAFWLAELSNTVKPPEPERETSLMLRKDINSDNNTRPRRRQSCAETLRCMKDASTVIPAHMHMVLTNFRGRITFQATLWLSSAPNSTEMVYACMVRGANFCIARMILRWN